LNFLRHVKGKSFDFEDGKVEDVIGTDVDQSEMGDFYPDQDEEQDADQEEIEEFTESEESSGEEETIEILENALVPLIPDPADRPDNSSNVVPEMGTGGETTLKKKTRRKKRQDSEHETSLNVSSEVAVATEQSDVELKF